MKGERGKAKGNTFAPDSIANFKPTKEDQEQQARGERMWGEIQNFLRRAMKGAYPDKETYSYFSEDEGTASGFGGTSLQLPVLGVILVNRERFRKIQKSVCASQCGIILILYQLDFGYEWNTHGPLQTREPNKEIHRELPECCPV